MTDINSGLDYRKTIDFEKLGIVSFSVAPAKTEVLWEENTFRSFPAARAFADLNFPHFPCVHAHAEGGKGMAMWDGDEWLVF